MKKITLILTVLLATGPQAWANEYKWTPVEAGEEVAGLRATGMIIPQEGAAKVQSATTPSGGRVVSILKRAGDYVTPGTPLFVVNDPELYSLGDEIRLARKNGAQDLIEAALQREKEMGVSVEDGHYEIVSLFGGVLTQINVSAGSVYNQGQPLASILDMKRLTVELDIAEKYVSDLHPGQKVTFQLASDTQKSYTSVIRTIIPTIDPTQRTTIVRLAPSPLPPSVNLSELVYGVVQTGDNQPVLKIPTSALVFRHDQQFVVKGDEKNPVVVPVMVVNETDEMSSVRAVKPGDLNVGDSVASEGAVFLFSKVNGIYGGDS